MARNDDDVARTKALALKQMCAELGADPAVSGIFLFGSHARGDGRPDSDIDLLVVRTGPFQRRVAHIDDVEFELFFNNEPDIVEYWRANDDDFTNFWADAQVLFDRAGATERLRAAADSLRP
ncbi:MAG: nucleotidyltransferase domain-containing protein [Planctomycetota bacterium]|nr:nucleotidyltransferase domain-containing protein [Planctomycetota bacterium]